MNIDDVIVEVRLDTRTSQKTNKPYKVLVLKLNNGYEANVFLHPAEVGVIENLMQTLRAK